MGAVASHELRRRLDDLGITDAPRELGGGGVGRRGEEVDRPTGAELHHAVAAGAEYHDGGRSVASDPAALPLLGPGDDFDQGVKSLNVGDADSVRAKAGKGSGRTSTCARKARAW